MGRSAIFRYSYSGSTKMKSASEFVRGIFHFIVNSLNRLHGESASFGPITGKPRHKERLCPNAKSLRYFEFIELIGQVAPVGLEAALQEQILLFRLFLFVLFIIDEEYS